jgi:KDO2-lipid IV(A) lauroyltransferase
MGSEQIISHSLKDKAAHGALRLFLSIFKIIPKKIVYSITKSLALAFYYASKRRREITQENLRLAFPSLKNNEVNRLSKEVFTELSKTLAEIFLMLLDRVNIDEMITNKQEVLDRLKVLDKAHPNGWIFMTAHFSNWELMAQFLAKEGYPMLVIGREGDNRLIESNITTPFRQKYGNKTAYKKGAAIAIFKTLKKGENVGILVDQKVYHTEAIKVKFFGRDAYTTPLIATMKQKLTELAVIPVFLPRMEDGRYELQIGDPLEESSSVEAMTQSYNDAMQEIITEHPAQWFWMHNRWKM